MSFYKKVEKIGKNAFFSEKSLWSQQPFFQKSYYRLSCKKCKINFQKKMSKKRIFIFWNFFFKMKIGHLFLSIFEIIKKVLKTKKLSIFSISLKLFGEMENDRLTDKNYKKILKKCEMSFWSFKNKNWTFWGFLCFFSGLYHFIFMRVSRKNE